MENKDSNKNFKESICIAHQTNTYQCDFYSKNGFAVHCNKVNSETDNIIKEIKNIKEDNIYLILENLNILEKRSFYEIILKKNKNIKIKTNNSLFLETLCSIKNNNVQYNQAANFLTLQIPLNHILLIRNTDIDILSVLKNNNIEHDVFIKLEIEIFQSFSVLDKFRANLLETAKEQSPNNILLKENNDRLSVNIDALCNDLSMIIHEFYTKYKEYLSTNNLINKINKYGEQEIHSYIQENIKPAMKKIESYILSYTEKKDKFLFAKLIFASIMLIVDLIIIGLGVATTPLGVGPLLISLGIANLSYTSSILDIYTSDKETYKEQEEINNLLSDLYFTVLLQSFGNSIKPLMEYEYKIRGNYIYTENSISIYSSYNPLNIYKNNDMPTYNINYKYNEDIQKDSTFSSVFNEIYIENENTGKNLKQIHDRFIELYQEKKDKIFNKSIDNLSQILYIETPLYTTPLLSHYLNNKINSNMQKKVSEYCNVIIFTNSLLSGQSPSVKQELTNKLKVNPTYHISFGAGAEDYKRNYGMHDYADYDLMINKVQEETSKIYPMFFSCFKYTEKTNYIDNILSNIEKIYSEYYGLLSKLIKTIRQSDIFIFSKISIIKKILRNQSILKNDYGYFIFHQDKMEYNKKIPYVKQYLINYFAYYNEIVEFINQKNISDDELNIHLNNLYTRIMNAFQPISYFYTNEQLDEYDMYEEYKDFIKDQIQEFLDTLIGNCEKEFAKITEINQQHRMEFKNYKKIMYPFILINFNIYDKYYEYFNNLYISTYDFITYRNKTIANIKLNHDKLSYNDIIFIKISEKIFDLSLNMLKNIVFSILFYTDITSSNIKFLHYDKIKENNLEDTFEYGIIYNFLNQQGVHVKSSFTLELYNIIKTYMTYEVFKKHTPSEYLVDENRYNECKEYVLNIITINDKNIRDTADSQTFQSTLIYLYEFILDHFKFKPEYINHHDVISEQETNITVESKDIANEIFLNIDSINEINEEIELKGLSSGAKKGAKTIGNYLFGALLDEVLQWIYDIPDKEKLKKYINLYNYMHLDNRFLPPHTVINQHTVCMPIDIINNLSIFDNKAVLFGDKNMDINSLINAYSLYANINDTDIAKSIFKERMKTYLTGMNIKDLDNVLLTEYKDKYNGSSIHGAGASKAWDYIAKEHKNQKKDEPLNINIETIKNMLGLKDEKLSDIPDNKETGFNGSKKEYNKSIDTPATTVAKSFYQAVCFAEGYKPDFDLVPKKIKAVQTDSKVIQKRNSSFTESLHEIARQNLRSAYMQVEKKEFDGEELDENIYVNQQPFIGIITLWVLPQNIIEG